MTTTITIDATTITPDQVDGYESTRQGGNIVHIILGRSSPDVTMRPAQLRSGTLTLVFEDEGAAKSAEDAHADAVSPAVLTSTDRGSIEMTYVVDGRVTRTLEDLTRDLWIVSVEFREIEP